MPFAPTTDGWSATPHSIPLHNFLIVAPLAQGDAVFMFNQLDAENIARFIFRYPKTIRELELDLTYHLDQVSSDYHVTIVYEEKYTVPSQHTMYVYESSSDNLKPIRGDLGAIINFK